jgi:hypothetical protein
MGRSCWQAGLIGVMIWAAAGCSGRSNGPPDAEQEGRRRYAQIEAALDKDGSSIDYDTLLAVYREMVSSPFPIPQADVLLGKLIDQRNADPRVDQMVLILAAQAIAEGGHPIADAQALFERILAPEAEERLSHWVLAHVADAVGTYPIDLPGGDALVDRMELLQQRLLARPTGDREYFGSHFLPPPKSRAIVDHLDSIGERLDRQRERTAYYMLLTAYGSEERIVAAFTYIQTGGLPDSSETKRYPLSRLVFEKHRLPAELQPGHVTEQPHAPE